MIRKPKTLVQAVDAAIADENRRFLEDPAAIASAEMDGDRWRRQLERDGILPPLPQQEAELGVRSDVVDLLHERGFGTVAGVFVGGCIERGVGSSFRAIAHTHTRPDDLSVGWICVRSPKRLLTPSGEPSRILRHEIAHTIAPKSSHGSKAFVAALASVGIHSDSYSRAGRNRIAATKPKTACRLCRKAVELTRSPIDGSSVWIHTTSGRIACLPGGVE